MLKTGGGGSVWVIQNSNCHVVSLFMTFFLAFALIGGDSFSISGFNTEVGERGTI